MFRTGISVSKRGIGQAVAGAGRVLPTLPAHTAQKVRSTLQKVTGGRTVGGLLHVNLNGKDRYL